MNLFAIISQTGRSQVKDLLKRKEYKGDNFLAAYIDALIYMPAIKFVKIHKYLQGCSWSFRYPDDLAAMTVVDIQVCFRASPVHPHVDRGLCK